MQSHFTIGHRNFGQLTTHVPGYNYKIYTNRAEADRDCDAIKKRYPQMKVLVCTPSGTPVRVAQDKDR